MNGANRLSGVASLLPPPILAVFGYGGGKTRLITILRGQAVGARRWAAALLVSLALSTPSARGQPAEHAQRTDGFGPPPGGTPMTLAQALARFRARGFDLLIADTAVLSAEADTMIARAVPNPSVGATVGKSFLYNAAQCNGCSDLQWSLSLTDQGALLDILSGRRALRIRVAGAGLAAARSNRADAQRMLEFDLKQQFVTAALGQLALENARATARSAEGTAALVAQRFAVGEVSEADVARADTAKLEAEQAVDSADVSVVSSAIALSFLLGEREPLIPLALDTAELRAHAAPFESEPAAAQLVNLAVRHRPDLQAAIQQEQASAANVELNRRSRVPLVAFSVGYQQEGSGQNAIQPPTVSFGLSTPLPLFYQYCGEIAKAEADRRASTIVRTKSEARIVADVQASLVAYRSARSRLARAEGGLLDRARRARDLVAIQYQKGAASLLELLDAERTLIAVNGEYVQNLADYWVARFALEQAVGTGLPR